MARLEDPRGRVELDRDLGRHPGLEWLGVLFNIADMRTVHSREAFTSLKAAPWAL